MATLYVMVGIPGAGKTTWAKSHPELQYIGSDELRRELYGKEMTMRRYGRVHRIMTQQALSHLLAGRDVVVDSAHVTVSARQRLLKDIPPHVRRVAVFLHTPLKQAFHNNRQRTRHVPEAGITALHCLLNPPTKQEGFDEIIYICCKKIIEPEPRKTNYELKGEVYMPDTNISQPTQHPKEKSIRDKFLEHWISIMYGLICCSMNMYFDPCVDYTKDSELFEKRKKQIAAYNGVICNITRFVKWLVSSEYHDYEDILLAAYNGDVEIKRLCRLHKRLSQTDVFALDPANIGRPGYQALIATPEYQFLQDIIHTDDNDTSSSDDEPPVYFGTDTLDCTTSDFDIARIVKEMEQSEQAFKEMRPVIKKQAEVMMENIRFTLLMYYDTQTDYYSASDARQVCLVRLMSCNKLVRLTEILLTDVTPYGERNAADIVHDIFGCDTNAAYLFDMYMKLKNKYHIMDYRCDELDFSDMGYHGFCRLPAEAVSALHAPLYSRQTNRCNNPTP